jgi:hypothetical protein
MPLIDFLSKEVNRLFPGKTAHGPEQLRKERRRVTRIRVLHREMGLTPAKFCRGKIDRSAEALRVRHHP